MKVSREHGVTKEEAKRKLDGFLEEMLKAYGSQVPEHNHEWVGDTMKFSGKAKGFSVSGTVQVTDTTVVIDVGLPLMARMFEGAVRGRAEGALDSLFGAQS
ncbi:MAG: polyhydroxyalkanoic acid system family protein [Chloroflexi bacterium]|nr:polyhydroxyalkanoic acid system family protein [Chloroflexota bacterium]